jgi:hypothetical protein
MPTLNDNKLELINSLLLTIESEYRERSIPYIHPDLLKHLIDLDGTVERLIFDLLQQDPSTKKPPDIQKKEKLSSFWDKHQQKMLYLQNKKPGVDIKMILSGVFDQKDTLAHRCYQSLPFFQHVKENNHTENDKPSTTPPSVTPTRSLS